MQMWCVHTEDRTGLEKDKGFNTADTEVGAENTEKILRLAGASAKTH